MPSTAGRIERRKSMANIVKRIEQRPEQTGWDPVRAMRD
jgi:hypothetical protein